MKRLRSHGLLAPATLLLLLCPAPARGWGFLGHRLVNARAIATLPPELRPLFEGNADYVSEHAVDPDLWRAAGVPGETPNHFLDMDAFGPAPPFPEIPRVEAEHLAKHGAAAAEKGRLPWRVAEVYRELVAAFRARDPVRILERAAVLGHYVGDAHVPLHAVVNYDGQLTGQHGVHNRWEGELVERFERQLLVDPQPAASTARDPVLSTFDTLLASFDQADDVLRSDRESTRGRDLAVTPADDRYDEGYYSRLFERQGERVRARLTRASEALGALWRQAWEEAGRPAVDGSFRFPYVRGRARAVLLSIDGAAAALVDDAVRRGIMPHLGALRRRGAAARGSLTAMPPKTAAGHASLYTGAWADGHGIVGNEIPIAEGSVIESNTGYDSTHLRAEPLWVTAARQGLDAVVATGTQVYPFAPFLEERRFGGNYGRSMVLFDGYQALDASDEVYTAAEVESRPATSWLGPLPAHTGEVRELRLGVEDVWVDGLLYDDPQDPARGFDTLHLALDRDPQSGIRLKPARIGEPEAFASLRIRMAGGESVVFFRLFALATDGSELLLYRTAPQSLRASPPRIEEAALQASGGFVGNGAGHAYSAGRLGPPLWDGGDGTAERRYLETAALVVRQFTRLTDFTLDRTDWDLLLTYLPYPDEALHAWLGRVDPTLPSHDPALAARLRPHLDEALRMVDGFIGHLAQRAGPDVVLAVATDHGMQGADRVLRPNVALAAAGLLAADAEGKIDTARTRAVYFRGNTGMVLLNRVGRPGGLVRPEEEEALRRQVVAALAGVRDPRTGQPVVLAVLDTRQAHDPPLPGGDFFLSVAPGYELSAAATGAVVESIAPIGTHRTDAPRPALHGSFAMAGPGVAAGVDLGLIRQVDVAPTLCALLGIDPPAQAVGRVLEKALARPFVKPPPAPLPPPSR